MKQCLFLISTVGFAVDAKKLEIAFKPSEHNVKGWFECTACQTAVPLGVSFLEATGTVQKVQDAVNAACKMELVPSKICKGSQFQLSYAWPNFKNFYFVPDFFCEEIAPYCESNLYKKNTPESFAKRILADKPEKIKEDNFVDNLYKEIAQDKKERKTLKVVHLADSHYDLKYKEGSDA